MYCVVSVFAVAVWRRMLSCSLNIIRCEPAPVTKKILWCLRVEFHVHKAYFFPQTRLTKIASGLWHDAWCDGERMSKEVWEHDCATMTFRHNVRKKGMFFVPGVVTNCKTGLVFSFAISKCQSTALWERWSRALRCLLGHYRNHTGSHHSCVCAECCTTFKNETIELSQIHLVVKSLLLHQRYVSIPC